MLQGFVESIGKISTVRAVDNTLSGFALTGGIDTIILMETDSSGRPTLAKSIAGIGKAVSTQLQAFSDGFALSGYRNAGGKSYDGFLTFLNATFDPLWLVSLGEKKADYFNDFTIGNKRGWYAAVGTMGAGEDMLLAQINATGYYQNGWVLADGKAVAVEQTSDDEVVVLGLTDGFSTTGQNILMAPFSLTHQRPDKALLIEGEKVEEAIDVEVMADGSKMILAKSESFGAKGSEVLLIHTDQANNPKWAWRYGGGDGSDVYTPTSLQLMPSGVAFTGYTNGENLGCSGAAWLVMVNPDGGLDASWCLDQGGYSNDLVLTEAGRLGLAGHFYTSSVNKKGMLVELDNRGGDIACSASWTNVTGKLQAVNITDDLIWRFVDLDSKQANVTASRDDAVSAKDLGNVAVEVLCAATSTTDPTTPSPTTPPMLPSNTTTPPVSAGGNVGILVGIVAAIAVLLATVFAFFCVFKKRRKSRFSVVTETPAASKPSGQIARVRGRATTHALSQATALDGQQSTVQLVV